MTEVLYNRSVLAEWRCVVLIGSAAAASSTAVTEARMSQSNVLHSQSTAVTILIADCLVVVYVGNKLGEYPYRMVPKPKWRASGGRESGIRSRSQRATATKRARAIRWPSVKRRV